MKNHSSTPPSQHSTLDIQHFFSRITHHASRVRIETLLLIWFVTTPLASFFVQFPLDKTIITYDRVIFTLTVVWLLSKWRAYKSETSSRSFFSVSRFEIVWAMLSVFALVSAATQANDFGYAVRIAVDAFWLPLIAFHLARRHFELQGRAGILVLGAMALAFFLFATGAYEYRMGENLFPYEGSELVREGEIRANGPFASDSSFANICLLLALFLAQAPQAMRLRLDASARLAWLCAIAAAAAASLLPLFRSIGAALVAGFIILGLGYRKSTKHAEEKTEESETGNQSHPSFPAPAQSSAFRRPKFLLSAAAMVLIALAAIAVTFDASSLGRRLTSLQNVYGRVATWEAAIGIASDRPLFGAGLTNYNDYYQKKYFESDRLVESVLEVRAAGFPHSNMLWIASELGLFAFALYAMANVYIFLMGYREFVRASGARRAAAACYLALVAAYWIPGLMLTTGAYSDLNLYFFFMLGLLLNICRGSRT